MILFLIGCNENNDSIVTKNNLNENIYSEVIEFSSGHLYSNYLNDNLTSLQLVNGDLQIKINLDENGNIVCYEIFNDTYRNVTNLSETQELHSRRDENKTHYLITQFNSETGLIEVIQEEK